MAEEALSMAVTILGDMVIQKANFLLGVEDQVVWLKDELQRMQCFLKDAGEKQAKDEQIRHWVSEIHDVAQDAEDAIEIFILKVEAPRSGRGLLLGRYGCLPFHAHHLNMVGKEIESIRKRLGDIERSRQTYEIQDLGQGTDDNSVEWRRRLSPWQKDKHVVGLDEDVKKLLDEAILEKGDSLSIVTIVGMGGIGKSTLAKKLYNEDQVVDRFECRAWVVASSEFSPGKMMKELIMQLLQSGPVPGSERPKAR